MGVFRQEGGGWYFDFNYFGQQHRSTEVFKSRRLAKAAERDRRKAIYDEQIVAAKIIRIRETVTVQSRAIRMTFQPNDGVSAWSIPRDHLPALTAHYYVDEAGDASLFGSKGRIILGTEGCSDFFMVGKTWVLEPAELARDLEALRADLLKDRYFKRVPSMQTAEGKTALFFHAKDDIPEVRWQVYRVLMRHRVKFFATVRTKAAVLKQVQTKNAADPAYRYKPSELYEDMITVLFRERLHQFARFEIEFAKRGTHDRTEAVRAALFKARENFARIKNKDLATTPLSVEPKFPTKSVCLQATDYFLWALQRLFERREARYWEYVWPAVGSVIDYDQPQGYRIFARSRKLTVEAVEAR